jgi:putative endonuclease
MNLPFCVYALRSVKDEGFYIGYSKDLKKRFSDHNCGNVSSTKSRRPLELIYCEFHKNKYDALHREKYFKTTSGKKTLKLMLRESLGSSRSRAKPTFVRCSENTDASYYFPNCLLT